MSVDGNLNNMSFLPVVYITVLLFISFSFLKKIQIKQLYETLSIIFLFLYYLNIFPNPYNYITLSLVFLSLGIKKSHIISIFLAVISFSLFFLTEIDKKLLISGLIISLATLDLKNIYWILSLLINGLVVYFYPELIGLSYLLTFIYILYEYIQDIKKNFQKEKRLYRTNLSRKIQADINQKLRELNEEIIIINKKLKSLFELSNYSISSNNIEDMATRVVNGLRKLGYTGVFFYFNENKKLYKDGFFPNLIPLIKNKTIDKSDDKYLLFPIKVFNEEIGILGIYKKSGLSEDEKEYLSIYANTIAIFLEKVYYSKEITKLREITLKVLDAVDIAIVVVDKELNITFENRFFQSIIQKKDSNNLIELLPQVEPLKQELQNVIKTGKKFETTLSSKNKGDFVYNVKAFPMKIDKENEFDGILIMIEDITRKEELETHIIQTEKLAILGRLVAGLSHDIRNPLAAISQAAFRIKRLSQKLSNEKLEELAKVIEKNVERSADIMERLLNFSKPVNQKKEIISLETLIDESLELSLVKKHKVKIDKNIEKDIYVYGDKNALIHGIVNLIINSLEAMNYEGTLSINLYKKDNKAVIEIKDTGKGIPENIKDKIFEPFFTTKDEGTGLGLFMLKKIIEKHNGNIKFITEKNKGTTFIIELPVIEEF